MKQSKLLRKSRNAQSEPPELPKPQQRGSEDDEKSRMIERRQAQARGEEICPECGGILFNIDGVEKCGDCGPWKGCE